MGIFRKGTKYVLEYITGYCIEHIERNSVVLYPEKYSADAWFSKIAQMKSIFEKFKINLVLDVGANQGQFSQFLRSFYFGEIHSFEPVSSVFEQLAAVSHTDPNWHIHKLALGSKQSTQKIFVSDMTVFSSMLKFNEYGTNHFGEIARACKEEEITVRRIEELLDDIIYDVGDKRIFLKMDTQGYDNEVFKGLGNKLKYVYALQSEVSLIPIYEGMPHWIDSISTFESHNFGVVGMYPVTRDSMRVIEYDCLMIKIGS